MDQKKLELFTERVDTNSRHYFFNVKKAENGSKYLVINESRKVGDEFKRNSIMIFEDDLIKFNKGLKSVTNYVAENSLWLNTLSRAFYFLPRQRDSFGAGLTG